MIRVGIIYKLIYVWYSKSLWRFLFEAIEGTKQVLSKAYILPTKTYFILAYQAFVME